MKIKLCILLSLFVVKSVASPLIFSNDFEKPPGTILFLSDEPVLFTEAGDFAEIKILDIIDHLGNVVEILSEDEIEWSLSSINHLSYGYIDDKTVGVHAHSFGVETVTLTAYHRGANATGQVNIILAEISDNTRVILDADVINGSTPTNGAQNIIVLQKNTRTEAIQVGDYVISGPNRGLLLKADQVTVNANDVTLLASRASFTQAFKTLDYSGVSQKSSYHAKIYGADNTIEVRDKKNGKLIYQKALFDSFSCELSGGGPAGINLTGASIDFEYDVTITPELDLSFFTVNEMSLTATANTTFAFTTGSVIFDSSVSGVVDCQVQSLPDFESPPAIIYGLWMNLAVTPSLGIKLQANINGPSATLSGPTGIASAQTQAGVRYTSSNGWEYIDANQFNYQFDLIDGEFSTDVAFSFSAKAYANASMNVEVSLGRPPFGWDIGQFDFMQADMSETLDFSMNAPFDPNDLGYSGPEAGLEGRFILTPKAGLSGAVFDALNDVLGIDLSFDQSFSPLIDSLFPHWTSPKPVITAPTNAPDGQEMSFVVRPEVSNSHLSGTFQILSDIEPSNTPDLSGQIVSGSGSVEWTPVIEDQGEVFQFYPRMTVDSLSQLLPYANAQPTEVTVDDLLITDVEFADANLEACVLDNANGQGWIYAHEVSNLTCESYKIANLSGIQSLTQLTFLILGRNQITDVSALGFLTQLSFLGLYDNQITNVTPLGLLTQLYHLDLNDNQISNVSALGSLTQLTRLSLDDNQINDVSVLSLLSQLYHLDLCDNQISNISTLGSLSQLTNLYLRFNQINEVSTLGLLTELNHLDLSDNQISNISTLGSLSQLTYLNLSANQIKDVSGLGSISQLSNLGLSNNQINDVSALGSLSQLTNLDLRDNQINDVSALGSLTQLTSLFLRENNHNIPCSQLAQFSFVSFFTYDNSYDVDNDGSIDFPPDGVDEQCGPF